MTEALDETRVFLSKWSENADVDELARLFPDCACEDAAPAPGGHGPIEDDEALRFFVASRSQIDIKRQPHGKITSAIFKRVFKDGMSVVRLHKAPVEEVTYAASLLYDHSAKQSGDHGGILGVVDFHALAVRLNMDDSSRICCVVDTPLHKRPAHADIVSCYGKVDEEREKGLRLILFNQVGGGAAFKAVANVVECDLSRFLPQVLKEF